MSDVETGQKIVSVVELMEWAEAIGFDAREAIKRLQKLKLNQRSKTPNTAQNGAN